MMGFAERLVPFVQGSTFEGEASGWQGDFQLAVGLSDGSL